MVGLSVLLESKKCPQTVIDKIALCRSPPARTTAVTTFLDVCLFCKKRLSPKDDIFMYKGDRAFCSVECRCRHIFMEEERVDGEMNCGLVAASANSSSSSSSSPAYRGRETTTGHRIGNFLAY